MSKNKTPAQLRGGSLASSGTTCQESEVIGPMERIFKIISRDYWGRVEAHITQTEVRCDLSLDLRFPIIIRFVVWQVYNYYATSMTGYRVATTGSTDRLMDCFAVVGSSVVRVLVGGRLVTGTNQSLCTQRYFANY